MAHGGMTMDQHWANFQRQQAMKHVAQEQQGALLAGFHQALDAQEAEVDKQREDLENMDEDDFEKLRERRRKMLIKASQQKAALKRVGHGEYGELADQPAFFEATKKSKKIVCHFYRDATFRCRIIDKHMRDLAARDGQITTRFCKIDAEKAPYLCERLGIVVLPTLLCIKEGKTTHMVEGFDEFGGHDDFTTDEFQFVLSQYEVVNWEGPPPEPEESEDTTRMGRGGVNRVHLSMSSGNIRRGTQEDCGDDAGEEEACDYF